MLLLYTSNTAVIVDCVPFCKRLNLPFFFCLNLPDCVASLICVQSTNRRMEHVGKINNSIRNLQFLLAIQILPLWFYTNLFFLLLFFKNIAVALLVFRWCELGGCVHRRRRAAWGQTAPPLSVRNYGLIWINFTIRREMRIWSRHLEKEKRKNTSIKLNAIYLVEFDELWK